MKIQTLAETLKNNPTSWEFKMERLFSFEGFNFKFQHIIDDKYIADFLFPEINLIIELDGRFHDFKEKKKTDFARDNYLRHKGFEVKRFKNNIVDNEPEFILQWIKNKLQRKGNISM